MIQFFPSCTLIILTAAMLKTRTERRVSKRCKMVHEEEEEEEANHWKNLTPGAKDQNGHGIQISCKCNHVC